jgi:hypothetical protein
LQTDDRRLPIEKVDWIARLPIELSIIRLSGELTVVDWAADSIGDRQSHSPVANLP